MQWGEDVVIEARAQGGGGGGGGGGRAEEIEASLRRFNFEEEVEGEEGGPQSSVVINREDADATAESLGDAPIDVKSITPHVMVKQVSLRLGREDEKKGGGKTREEGERRQPQAQHPIPSNERGRGRRGGRWAWAEHGVQEE